MDAVASPGSAIGPYRVEGTLGSGGWSTVYAVIGPGGEPLALKRLHDDLPPQALARFRREVDSLRMIDHPGVLRLVDAGVDGRAPYLVTPRVSGKSLRELAAGGVIGIEAAVVLIAAAADAVGAIHGVGLVHRDLKPDNIMVTATGEVVVIDLGLALGPDHSRHTAEDSVTGSVPYMAPEQIEDRAPSAASDVWALAVVLYELATGRRPFQRDRTSEEVAAILAGRFEALDAIEPRSPDTVARLVEHCLAAAPARRQADGTALAAALAATIDWLPPAPAGARVPTIAGGLAGERARLAVSPRGYAATVAPLRVARAIDAARAALAAHDLFAAGRHVDRGLAIAPEDPTLRGLLDQMLGASSSLAPAPAPAPTDDAAATTVDLRVPTAPAAAPRSVRRLQVAIGLVFAAALIAGIVIAATRTGPAKPSVAPAAIVAPPGPAEAAPALDDDSDDDDDDDGTRDRVMYDPKKVPDQHEITRPSHIAPSQGSATPPPIAQPAPAPPSPPQPQPSGVVPVRPRTDELTRPASVVPSQPASP